MIIRNSDVRVLKKNGTRELFTPDKIRNAINKSASRASVVLSNENQDQVVNLVVEELDDRGLREVSVEKLHTIVEGALEVISPSTAKSYKDYRNFKAEFGKIMEDVYNDVEKIMYRGDKENANKDSSLVSTKKSLSSSSLYKEIYKETFLTDQERHMIVEGDYYIHDMSDRLTCINCCLFRIGTVLKDGFEMANVWYNEPKTLKTAFDVISDVVLSAASQQYGGFTIPQVDKILSYYAEKSYKRYYDEYIELGLSPKKSNEVAERKIAEDYRQGFQGWEYKFNTVSSSRGDYPFITVTSGLDTSKWGHLGNKVMYQVHQEGQGKKGFKKPVLFPKYVFLYDKELHGPGKELYDVFEAGQECSQKTMYPDWLSLTGEGYVPSMYKQYKAVVSPMGCVDGKEVITYKVDGQLFVENFETFWSRFESKAVPQSAANDINLVVDLKNEDVLIYDTKQGFVKVTNLIRNVSKQWNKVKLSNGRSLLCTTDHPFETENRGMVYAKDLVKTDIILCQNKKVDHTKKYTYENTILFPEESNVLDVITVNKEGYSYDVSTVSEHFEVSGIYSHNCRAFLSPYYEKGGQVGPLDETDKPVFEGRFNSGAVSLNLPLIYLRSVAEGKDFYEVLDDRLEQIRQLHQRTRDYIGNLYASTNPLAFTQEGVYGGNLKPNQRLKESKELMDSTTYSFGITALDELQKAYNGRSLAEDGQFSLDVLKYINEKATQFKEEDHMLYAIYGTPAESLCGKQIKQLRTFVAANVPVLTTAGYEIAKKGEDYVIPGVCDREYVSNSFHCNVREDISPIQKQDLENRFWNYCNGGKIQYVRYPIGYNHKAMDTLISRAMEMGLYEGCNLSLSYCEDCGHQELDLGDSCPHCGSQNLTKVDRMNGYLAFSRVNGESRLNDAKMDEIKDRLSM